MPPSGMSPVRTTAQILAATVSLALGLMLVGGGCQVPGLGEGAGGGSEDDGAGGGGDEGTACEEASEACDVCATCAAQGPCVELITACGVDAMCSTLDSCLGICGGEPECADGCYMSYPDAVQLHGQAMGCVYCDQCARHCGAAAQCI